jgi:hypothetical protein
VLKVKAGASNSEDVGKKYVTLTLTKRLPADSPTYLLVWHNLNSEGAGLLDICSVYISTFCVETSKINNIEKTVTSMNVYYIYMKFAYNMFQPKWAIHN